MDNYYHLLIETPEPNLSQDMRRLNPVYTQAFNRRYGRVGHVLQGRYNLSSCFWLVLTTGASSH
jgi:putative transposase